MYVSEIAGPDIRGCLSAVLKMVGQVGVLLSFLGGAYLDWRQLAMVVAVAPVMLFVSVLYVPETPSYLVLAGKDDEAARALQWLRGPDADVGPELAVIRSNILSACPDTPPPRSPRGPVWGTWHPAAFIHAGHQMLRPALTTCGLMLFQVNVLKILEDLTQNPSRLVIVAKKMSSKYFKHPKLIDFKFL